MSSPKGKERRKLKRFVRRIPAKFSTQSISGTGHVKNLSKEGLFVRTNSLPKPGEEVSVIVLTPDRHKVEVVGLVRWTTAQLGGRTPAQPGFGVRIEHPTEAFLAFFAALLVT